MTISEIQQLHDRICDHILASRLKEAFSGMGFLLQQNGFGKAYDQLTETENKYRYMLRYRVEGFPDPDFEKNSLSIRRLLIELAGEGYHAWMIRNAPSYYYDRLRIKNIDSNHTVDRLATEMRAIGEKITLMELVEQPDNKSELKLQMNRQREQLAGKMFMTIFVADLWKEQDESDLQRLFDDPALFEHEKALLVSALYLSIQKRFDLRKILFLLRCCGHQEAEISQRALVALILTLYEYQSRLFLYPEISMSVKSLMETHAGMDEAFVRVFYQLIRSKDTDAVTKRMQEEILPEMNKMGSTIQEKLKEGEDLSDEFNPDWQNMMENSSFSIKMQQFSDMQMEGIDVYLGTFSTQKGYSFFYDFHNWFLPFYPAYSGLHDLFSDDEPDGKSVLEAVLNSDYLCSSDKYSFCFNLLQVPANYRNSMSTQINADSEAYDEIKKAKMGVNSKYRMEQISNRYIQDLYRFYKLHGRRNDFVNPFEAPLDFLKMELFESCFQNVSALKKIGLLLFKNKHHRETLPYLNKMLEYQPDDVELLQKRGYCLQHLNEFQLSLESYLQADLVNSNSLWNIKKIAFIYRQLKQPEKALEYYNKAEAIEPNDFNLTMSVGHAYFEAGNYVEALNRYFKAALLREDSALTWRPIAWCSFLCRKYDQANKYYSRILEQNPTIEDFLNAGHVTWCQGAPLKAVEIYKKGVRVTHITIPEFLELFKKDVVELQKHSLSALEIQLLRDELLYQLEE